MNRDSLERKFVIDLLNLLDYQQAEVDVADLDAALDRGDIYAVYDQLGIGAGSDIRPKLAALFALHLRASFEAAIEDYLEPFGTTFNVSDPALARLISEQANESAVLMLTHARATVDGTLRRHAGADTSLLAALLISGMWLTDRQSASVVVAILLGLGLITRATLKRWVTADDEKVWFICGPMHGGTVPVEADFSIPLPPHPQCRCYPEFA